VYWSILQYHSSHTYKYITVVYCSDMTERTTDKDVEGMIKRLRLNTNLNLGVGHAYGNHYTLELRSSENTGISDIGFAIGKGNFYNLIYGANRIIEAMQSAKESERFFHCFECGNEGPKKNFDKDSKCESCEQIAKGFF
jgi:hypothetical protein